MKLIASSLLLVSVAACTKTGGGVKSSTLVQVIENRTDDFPSTHRVVVPLSGRNSLGSSVDALEGRRITPRYNRCFFVVEEQGNGVDKITQTFGGSAAIKTEFAAVAASAGGELKTEDEVIVEFGGIQVYGGYGIPNPSAPCGKIQDGTKLQVVTEQIRAATAQVQFSHSYIARLKAGGGFSKVQAQVAAGWEASTEGQVLGKNIILTSRVDEVQITMENEEQVLPDDVKPGTALTLPKSVRDLGFLAIQRMDTSTDTVTIKFQPKIGGNLEIDPSRTAHVPENRCAINKDHALGPNQGCLFWLEPGNAALQVSWVRTPDNKKQLTATYYRTTMEPVRSKVAAEQLRDKLASQ